jgi:hypothetical protein
MNRARALVALSVLLAVLGLAGCRGAERGALPASTSSGAAASADPLAGIEHEVDSVERDVDSDANPDTGPGR